jgi:heme-degrading monooxygenase HmoA
MTAYLQPGDATTFKSILNEYGRDDEVPGFVVSFLARPRRMFIVSRIW